MATHPSDLHSIGAAISLHGVAPNPLKNLARETEAAHESLASGLYVCWVPHPSCILGNYAADEVRNGTGQCCRVGSNSICFCGHSLLDHKVIGPKSGYMKPPVCTKCRRCQGFQYAPSFPEECGQWWLARRQDFNITEWRKRVRASPSEYCCVGCEQKVSDHETLFENRATRASRGAVVDEDYIPLTAPTGATVDEQSELNDIRQHVQRISGRGGVLARQILAPVNGPSISARLDSK